MKRHLWREMWWNQLGSCYCTSKHRLTCWAAPGPVTSTDNVWTEHPRYGQQNKDGMARSTGWESQAGKTASADRPSRGGAESKPLGSLTSQGVPFKLYFEPLNMYCCRSAWFSLARTLPFRNPQSLEGDWQSHVWMEAPTFPPNLLALWDLLLGFFYPLYNLAG